ncbi:MAG TPA: hypothetical protein VF067_08325 [Sphingomicrobium sp.]
MGCCSSFTAVAGSAATADPSRHVNFTTGMVLGVDDYHQEFVYHSARDKWMVRDLLGYGTLSGLAVDVQDDGTKGPRVCVSAGSAAAPSGQLICVGRDQCGSINAWLARKEVSEKLGKIIVSTADSATLVLFVTLCYVDCPVADVPIPGEPCRSDENLMAPSRIADDYCLELRFGSPPMGEAQAPDILSAFWGTLNVGGGNPATDDAFTTALRQAEAQLTLAMGIGDPAALPPDTDLGEIKLHPDAVARFSAAVKKLWVTRLRPRVAAQRCNAEAVAANDCVLLSRLTVPIVKPGADWVVAGLAATVTNDETGRPILLAANFAQTVIADTITVDAGAEKIAFITSAGTITPTPTLVVIRSDAKIDVKIPGSTAGNSGKRLTIRSASTDKIKLTTPASTTIGNENERELNQGETLELISDGDNKNWYIASDA